MSGCVWYISKYVAPPSNASAGGRGYQLMREFVRQGYTGVIVTSDSNHLAQPPELKSSYMVEHVDGLQLCWLRTLKYTAAKSARRILSWLDFEWQLLKLPKKAFPRPDSVIVSSLSLLTILNGLLLRYRYKCRLVFEIRDIWPLTIVEEGGYSPRNLFVVLLGLVERLGYRYADAIVGTMPNLGEHVAGVLGHEKQTYCIPMGIESPAPESPQLLPTDYVDRYLPRGKFIVAHVGSIGITNALDSFFECARLMRDNPKIHFLMVGDGDLRERYQREYSELANLTFAPKILKAMVHSLLSQCDLLYFSVFPSKVWRYGQSLNKVIDYMLAGKPIVASYSGFPSMINEAGCGTYVPSNDPHALAKEIGRYAEMSAGERTVIGVRGREWLTANRSYSTLAKSYLKILFPNSEQA